MFELIRTAIAKELQIEEKEVTLKSSLTEDFGMDSMDIYNLVDALYEAGVKVKVDSIFETVDDIVATAEIINRTE